MFKGSYPATAGTEKTGKLDCIDCFPRILKWSILQKRVSKYKQKRFKTLAHETITIKPFTIVN